MKHIHTIVWKENKWFVAKALEVEVTSQGKSQTEALKNLQQALELYFEDNKDLELISVKEPKLQEVPVNFHA